MRRLARVALACACACATAGPAFANDTTARVAAGGIEPLKSADVRMLQETLTISRKLVTVRYRFLNESDRDVHATIAFPMPAYGWWSGESEIDSHSVPMDSFEVKVDGAVVPTRSVRRALVRGRDVTRELRALGLSDEQLFVNFGRASSAYRGSADLRPGLEKRVRKVIGGTTMDRWQVEETRLWEQTFPAHREIVVEHRYAPFVGRIYDAPYQKGHAVDESSPELAPSSLAGAAEHSPAEACVDDELRVAMQRKAARLAAGGAASVWRNLEDVEYILGTGRNWKGPIADFTLRIEKDKPGDIVSLCFPGQPKRVSPTVLEFHQVDLVPQDRLVVYFYSIEGLADSP